MALLGARDGKLATGRATLSRSRLFIVALVVAGVGTLVGGNGAQGQEVLLGTAQRFAVLAASTITNANATTINGDVGLYPGTAVTGFGTVTQTGSLYVAPSAVAQQGQADARTAYNSLRSRPCTRDLTGQDLGTVSSLANPLVPGVYCFSSSAQLTGTLYLAGGGPYVFLIGTTLITAPNSSVVVVDPTQQGGCDIFWAVGTSATLDTGTQFVGTIIAEQSISALSGAVIRGRLIALGAAVTMDNNTITRPTCATTTTTAPPGATTTTTAPPGTTTTTPLPVTTITIPGTTIVVPGATIVIPGTTIVVPITILPATTTTAAPGITTTTGLQGTTSTTLQGGSGPGPTTTVVQGATTSTTRQATTTTAGGAATTTTVGSGTTAATTPGGGTGSGTSASDSLAGAARSGQALARTGPTDLQPMVVGGLLAMTLGAMMLIPAASAKRRP